MNMVKYIIYIIYFISFLTILNPLYRRILGEFNLNFILYGQYTITFCLALFVYFLIRKNFNFQIMFFLFFLFIVFYLLSNLYTISNDTTTKTFTIFLLPFYFIIGYSLNDFNVDIKYFFYLIPILFSIYLLTVLEILLASGFVLSIFYKNDIVIDYLTLSLFLLIYTIYSNYSNSKFQYLLGIVFLFISIISGARFPIVIFLILSLQKVIIKWYTFICLLVISILIFVNIDNFDFLFDYSLTRFNSLFQNDDSLNERIVYIDKCLTSFNNYPFFGRGINSSGFILYETQENHYPHNFIIESLIEVGLLGTLPLLFFFIYYFLFIHFKQNNKFLNTVIIFILLNFFKSFSIVEIRILLFFMGYSICNNSNSKHLSL